MLLIKTLFLKNVTLCPMSGQNGRLQYIPSTTRWLNDHKATRYSEQRHGRHTEGSCYQYLLNFNWIDSGIWAICAADGHVGNISAHINYANLTADIGVLIGHKHWGRGYASEAWQGLSTWLLANGITKIEAGCMANNKGMIKVFKRCGMKYEGRRIKHFQFSKTKRVDVVYYGKFK